MIQNAENVDVKQISLTGARAIALLGLLMQKPAGIDEIKQQLIKYGMMDKSQPDDVLRIDLNTLKHIGCKISRACKTTGYKYILEKHPFSLKFDKLELNALKRIYNDIKSNCNVTLLEKYDNLFHKLSEYITDDETREALLGISVFKYYPIELIKALISTCEKKNILTITYKKPTAKMQTEKHIVAEKLVCRSNKIYLYGYDIDKQESVMLNLKRLTGIIETYDAPPSFQSKTFKINYHLFNIGEVSLDNEDEKLIETTENGYIIEGTYHNDFIAMQRVLSFGANCTVLEPEKFKNKIIQTLKKMRKIYER